MFFLRVVLCLELQYEISDDVIIVIPVVVLEI